MGKITDIEDRNSLEAWLKDQPREVSVWIASRAAARVLPDWWEAVLDEDWARKDDLTSLPILHCLFLSSVVALVPTDGIKLAAADAAYAADAAASAAAVAADAATDALEADVADAALAANHAAYAACAAAYAATHDAADADAAHAAASDAAGHADIDATFWTAVRKDAEQVSEAYLPNAFPLWPDGAGPLANDWVRIKEIVAEAPDADDWQFWLHWYDAQLAGRTLLPDPARTWEMLEKIATEIDPEIWVAGPEVVNPKIRKIWEGYKDGSSSAGHAADPEPVSDYAKSAMKQRVAVNRDALVVASAGIIDELGTFKEQVRGMNHLEPDLRDEVLAFIDDFTGKLSELIKALPASGSNVDDDQAGRLVLWLREYRGLLRHKLAYYGSAENMAEATVPTGIILGATGIGAMLGMPVAGSVVGGLIVNQMKPGQAARELTKPSGKETDLP